MKTALKNDTQPMTNDETSRVTRKISPEQRTAAKIAAVSSLCSMIIVVLANYGLLNPLIVRGSAAETARNIVAHETRSFLAYESITRAHTGDPNVLISRSGRAGEFAIHGDGFYTQVGRTGAGGTGLTIRFHLAPSAREGTDFILAEKNAYVVVLNKAALKVIPESLNLSPVQYFEFLASGERMSHEDLALLH